MNSSLLTGLLSTQVDNAQTLCSMGGLKLILQGLNSSDVRVQENSAFVLGSALARCVLIDLFMSANVSVGLFWTNV